MIEVTADDVQNGVDDVDAQKSLHMVVSPWVKRNYVRHVHDSYGSLFKTFRKVLGLPYLNQYDAAAIDLADFFADYAQDTPMPCPWTHEFSSPSWHSIRLTEILTGLPQINHRSRIMSLTCLKTAKKETNPNTRTGSEKPVIQAQHTSTNRFLGPDHFIVPNIMNRAARRAYPIALKDAKTGTMITRSAPA
jgi:hypothetical protein